MTYIKLGATRLTKSSPLTSTSLRTSSTSTSTLSTSPTTSTSTSEPTIVRKEREPVETVEATATTTTEPDPSSGGMTYGEPVKTPREPAPEPAPVPQEPAFESPEPVPSAPPPSESYPRAGGGALYRAPDPVAEQYSDPALPDAMPDFVEPVRAPSSVSPWLIGAVALGALLLLRNR